MKATNKYLLLAACSQLALLGSPQAHAVNLITNGDFSSTNADIVNQQIGVANSAVGGGAVAAVTGWVSGTVANPLTPSTGAVSNLNFIFGPSNTATVGVTGNGADGFGALTKYTPNGSLSSPPDATGNNTRLSLYSSVNSPSLPGVSVIPSSSPNGGNFVALDGSADVGPLSQQLSGLTIGNQYDLSFYWAAAQQKGYQASGLTELLKVSLGSQSISTAQISYAQYTFQDWRQVTMRFTADSVSPVLSFLSVGTPDGLPPFALLDGVSLEAVPEPSAALLGSLGVLALLRRRRA